MVDRAIISAFAKATMETCAEMCQTTVTPRRAVTDAELEPGDGVHALIGMEGAITGAISLSMPTAVACGAVSRMVGMDFTSVDSDVADGVQELVNIIIGRAKKHLEEGQLNFQFGLPKTLVGHQFPTSEAHGYRNLPLRFAADWGEFLVYLTWKQADG